MKLGLQEHVDVASGVQDEVAISFEANAVAFYAQISGLAKDKIGYPIRELTTNMWDGSRLKYGDDIPEDKIPQIRLPTQLSPTISFRDFGPGMSPDDMKNVYARLYASTKRGSNDQVGGWGLGSKSPYAYLISDSGSGSYTVTSYHGGMMRTYVLSLSQSGAPTMRLLIEAPSDEPTGLEVSFPVRREDIREFHDRARSILWSFTPRPKITPAIDWKDPVVMSQGDNYTRYKNGTVPFNGPHVRMGCVMYPFDMRQIKTTGFLDYSDAVLFDAPIGSLKVTLSREELAYDDNTKATLARLTEEYEQNFIRNCQTAVDTAEDLIGAVELFEEATQSLGVSRTEKLREVVKWRGKTLSSTVPKINCKTGMLADGWVHFDKFEDTTVRMSWCRDAKIVIEHNPSYSYSRFQMAQLVGQKVLWIRCKRAFREEVLNALGNPEVVELDTFKVPASKRTRGKTVRRRRVMVVTEGGGVLVSQEDVDLAEGGFYLQRVSNGLYSRRRGNEYVKVSTEQNSVSLSVMKEVISASFELGLVEEGTTILIQSEDHAALGDNWTLFGDDLIPDLQAKIDVSTFTGLHQKSFNDLDSALRGIVGMTPATFANAPGDLLLFKTELTALGTALRGNSTVDTPTDKAHSALSRLGIEIDKPEVQCPITAMERRYRELCSKYALLKLIIEPNPYYSYSNRTDAAQTQRQLKHYCDLLHAEQQLLQRQADIARAALALNDNNQNAEPVEDEIDPLAEAA
ncbi:hypothetical protein [Bradyrhizobium elkanii]|uniref:hypothetical protein n=1 Tax=Bradyrhizobium elkanii TaxID=29448 RepID=UPI00271546A5|nr:hypothetical protein [Bradyrhizobium elkanii]WLB04159.1 hypothetical protein QNJ80_20100 [Bradyrhizobium elkanii]